MKVYQAWISLAVLLIAGLIISSITNATLADKYASPEKVPINWQEEAVPNGKDMTLINSAPTVNKDKSETQKVPTTIQSSSYTIESEQSSALEDSVESVESEVDYDATSTEDTEPSGQSDL